MSWFEFRARLHYPAGFALDAEFATDARATALVGPSGSGKTTILSIIAGLRVPDAGLIRLGGKVLLDTGGGVAVAPEARGIGYVFQQQLLFPHLSARENLLYGWNRRRGRKEKAEVERIIDTLDLGDVLDRMPATLSGGQRQRVALGRALSCSPELLLLDEPLASVDEDRKEQVLRHLQEILREWQIPALYVTHDSAELRQVTEDIVYLRDGRVTT